MLGGDAKHTIDGVITLTLKRVRKYWVLKERAEEAMKWFEEHDVPGVIALVYSSVKAWATERVDAGEELPDFIKSSEDAGVAYKRSR